MIFGKRGFQLSMNMFVVLFLSLVILGIGFSLFAENAATIADIQADVSEQNQATLNRLLDDGGILVMPFRDVELDRGDFHVFNLGVANELEGTYNFGVVLTYAGSNLEDDPYVALTRSEYLNALSSGDFCQGSPQCATNWVQAAPRTVTIPANEREYFNIGLELPRALSRGQYQFNVDVCYAPQGESPACLVENGRIANQYGTRIKFSAIVN